MTDNLPDTSDAEEWITADIFRYEGKLYQIDIWGKITEYAEGKYCFKCRVLGHGNYCSRCGSKLEVKYKPFYYN